MRPGRRQARSRDRTCDARERFTHQVVLDLVDGFNAFPDDAQAAVVREIDDRLRALAGAQRQVERVARLLDWTADALIGR